jgi:hypothetical protein
MNAGFFGLAFVAALNPKLLVLDLLLIGNQRPRQMFVCFLLGGLGVSLTVGLLDVFVLQADAIQTQGSVSAEVDLALGVPLVAFGAALATGHLHRRLADHPQAGIRRPSRGAAWAQRALSEPRLGIAVLIGAIVGTPGAAYIVALNHLVTGTSSTASQAVAVVLFVLVEFSLVIVPFIFLQLRPRATEAKLRSIEGWLMSHARQLIAAAAILAGSYMTISGLVRLVS